MPNHLISATDGVPDEVRGRALRVRKLEMLPVECVVRGYITGSGWKDYGRTGVDLRDPAARAASRSPSSFPSRSTRPSTKAEVGHDETISYDATVELVGAERAAQLREASIALYEKAAAHARERGIILADTKFEFGLDPDGDLVVGDEVLTPDSSRFWPVEGYEPGHGQPSFDKQYVRDWASESGWDKSPPAPAIPDDVVAGTRAKYVEAYELITGEPFDAWLAPDGALMRVTVLVRPKAGILDPQGQAVERALPALGFAGVGAGPRRAPDRARRRGRRRRSRRCARRCSTNPLIEDYEIVEGVEAPA